MADTHTSSAKLVVLLLAVTMLTVTMPVMATHNSVGVGVEIMEADEAIRGVDAPAEDRGTIQQDVDNPATFHEETAPRPAPEDQTGDRYRADECDSAGQIGSNGDTEGDGYNPWADDTDCYIGFFDGQMEYQLLLGGPRNEGGGALYPVNPAEDDGYCRGEEKTENRSVAGEDVPTVVGDDSEVDEAITSATRVDDDECDGSGHAVYNGDPFYPKLIGIDTDQLEGPSEALGEELGTNTRSGTLTFPFMLRQYIFIFGEPHPDAPDSGFDAGSGPFGPSPTELGGPLQDLTGVCGDRTQQCSLLNDEDIKAYDTHNPKTPEQTGARVCFQIPQYFSPTPGSLTVGPCGPFGNQVTQYLNMTAGGFGVTEQPTWANTMPGWHSAITLVNHQSSTEWFDFNCDGGSACHDYLDDGDQMEPGNLFFFVVNPKVPTPDHPLWCVKPNFIGEPGTTEGGLTDNGYFDYTADAIDSDIYTHFMHKPMLDVRDVAHDPVRDTVRPVQEVLPFHRSDVTSAQAIASAGSGIGDESAEDRINEENPPAIVSEAIDRGDFTESGSSESHAEFHPSDYDGDEAKDPADALNQRPFTKTQKAGVGCNSFGLPEVLEEDKTQLGGLDFDVNLDHDTAATVGTPAIKDPTLLEGLLPAGEEGTEHGGWEAKTYSFQGSLRGVLDTNNDSDFDACTQALGQPQPTRDQCPWQPVWDAYNPSCTGPNDESCEAIVNASGYDNETGVGLYAVLHVTGPVVVYDEDANTEKFQDRLAVLGDDSGVDATHCIVTTTVGFAPKLADHLGLSSTDALTGELCRDVDGEKVLIDDGFEDQSGSGGSGFDAQIEFAKLLPTPDAVRNDLQTGFGDDDELCANAFFAVQDDLPGGEGNFTDTDGDGLKETKDSEGHIRLEEGHTYEFQDCDRLESSNDGQH